MNQCQRCVPPCEEIKKKVGKLPGAQTFFFFPPFLFGRASLQKRKVLCRSIGASNRNHGRNNLQIKM